MNVNPSYKESDEVYYSDTCLPLVNAWENKKVKMEAWARFSYPRTHEIEDGVLPGLSSVGYWDATSSQDWGLGLHRNEGIEISFLEAGTMPFTINDQEYHVKPDEIIITRPWQPHQLGNPNIGTGKLYWIILDVNVRYPHQEWKWPSWVVLNKEDLAELTELLRYNELPIWKSNGEIKKCFQKIGNLLASNDSIKNETWIVIYINELLMHCLEFFRSGALSNDKNLTDGRRAVEYFIEDLNSTYRELWTLESMAEYCSLGSTRFSHYFKQLTNMSPMQYLNSIRLAVAAKMIVDKPELSISQICYDCGYSSSQYFSTIFRKQYGCTPLAYRNNI